jgi:hypothetical protein
MKKLITFSILMSFFFGYNQTINGVNISEKTKLFELYAFKKPFSIEESFFIDYGQDKFRPHYYDHKTQAIINDEGEKFKKGDYIGILKFMKLKGWQKINERESFIGDIRGRIITYEKID